MTDDTTTTDGHMTAEDDHPCLWSLDPEDPATEPWDEAYIELTAHSAYHHRLTVAANSGWINIRYRPKHGSSKEQEVHMELDMDSDPVYGLREIVAMFTRLADGLEMMGEGE